MIPNKYKIGSPKTKPKPSLIFKINTKVGIECFFFQKKNLEQDDRFHSSVEPKLKKKKNQNQNIFFYIIEIESSI
jgi:hypothetical protein